VIARYNILSLFQRESTDQRSFGDLFRACNEELANITFLDALRRIMQLAKVTLRKAQKLSDQAITSILDAIMGEAIAFFDLNNKRKSQVVGDLR
jgi:predicted ribosome quality control (RQC) complex YloA/Tae2 family protein